MVGTDAPVGSAAPSDRPQLVKRHMPPQGRQPPAKRQNQFTRQHNVNDDGMLDTNRKGVKLCDGFNKGTCWKTNQHGRCLATGAAHQCAKCLEHDHGAHECEKKVKAPRPTPKGKGKGKSKGKWYWGSDEPQNWPEQPVACAIAPSTNDALKGVMLLAAR